MVRRLAALVALAVLVGSGLGADEPKKREKPKYEKARVPDPDGIGTVYMGREIAQVMSYLGGGWLDRPERVKEEEPAKLIKALDVKPGMVVADIGAGRGYHTFMLAPLVGDEGKVIAVDIQEKMLNWIDQRAKERKVTNVRTVKGTDDDPKLPAGGVDLIIMVDVYHEFSKPFEMAEKMVDALKPGGRLVFVEFRAEDDNVPIKPLHKMTEKQVIREMEPFPEMEHTKTVGTLPWQHVVIFTKKAEK